MATTWDIRNLDTQLFRLDAMKEQLQPGSRLFQQISQAMSVSIQSNFDAGGRDPHWPSRKKIYAHPILVKTGRMKEAALRSAMQNWQHRGQIHDLDIVSTSYAKYHQYGTQKLPIRKFVKLVQSEIDNINTIIQKHLKYGQ